MDETNDFGFNPFSTGDPSGGGFFQPVTEENVGLYYPSATPQPQAVTVNTGGGSLLNTVATFANLGRTLTNDVFSYNLQSQQIARGQAPSIATDKTGRPSGQLQQLTSAVSAGSWGTIALFGGAAILLVVLMTAGRK